MHFSIPISGLFALLAGQACSQSASGHYVIQDNTGALTAQGDIAVFADVNGSLDQVWDFAPVGPESVVLQNQAEGNYLTCDKSGSPCSVSADPQVFVPNSQGGDFYEIKDEAKEFLLVEDEDRTVVLAKSAGPGQRSLFKLVRTEYYKTTPLLYHTPSALSGVTEFPAAATSKRLNYFQAINSALRTALSTSDKVLLFGEDVAFGGVFRCSMDLQTEFGSDRVFNTPLTEQGIAGFAIGAAAEGMKPVAEIQFADYVFPAFDQIINEAAKFRYREGGTGINVGGLVIRMPCGAVGHGALYHSQSPESLFAHVPGVRVVVPRSPSQAKGLLLSSIFEHNDPVIFMEPKILYRAAVEYVPNEYYTIPLSKAEVIKPGKDLTVISYGQPLYMCSAAISALEKAMPGVNVELIDLRTIYPWDRQTVLESVRKTGRAIVVHESMINYGVGAEVAATIQQGAFLRLEAPVKRVAGWSTHTGLTYEQFILPDVARIYDAMKQTLEY